MRLPTPIVFCVSFLFVTFITVGGEALAGTGVISRARDSTGLAAAAVSTDPRHALLTCAQLAVDADRLRCYDAISEQLRVSSPATAAAPSGPSATAVAMPAADAGAFTPAPSATVPGAAAPSARGRSGWPDVRVAIGYGFGIGDHTGSFRVLGGTLDLQSAVGNSGDIADAQIWVDRLIGENWTVGLEYLGIRNEGKLRLTLPHGLSILTDPVQAAGRVKARADMGFLNLAWRPAGGHVHPFVGAGIGIGYGAASAWFDAYNAFLGGLSTSTGAGKPIAGVQAFTGVDIDLAHGLYLGVMPRFLLLNGHPVNVDQRFMEFSVDGLIGYRF